jgi:hypothetical protein
MTTALSALMWISVQALLLAGGAALVVALRPREA